jgi:hypothetical protein
MKWQRYQVANRWYQPMQKQQAHKTATAASTASTAMPPWWKSRRIATYQGGKWIMALFVESF